MMDGDDNRGLTVTRLVVIVISLFFLFFGINLMAAAYKLRSPHDFVLTFFSASLIILISVSVALGYIIQIFYRKKDSGEGKKNPGGDQQDQH